MNEELIERVIAYLRTSQQQLEEAQQEAARWEAEALVQSNRADEAEASLARCNEQATRLARGLENCRTNVRTAMERNAALRERVVELAADLRECRASGGAPEPQPTVILNRSTGPVRVELNGRSYLVAGGESLAIDDSGDRIEITGP